MNKETEEQIIEDLLIELQDSGGDKGKENEESAMEVFDRVGTIIKEKIISSKIEALQQERERITSIVQKEIAKSDKYQIGPLERIRYNINNYK